jgi:dTDP-4-dehydrorhamnose reductase
VNDQFGSPSWARALAAATADLLRDRERVRAHGGVYHLSASGHTSRFEFARAIVRVAQEIGGDGSGWAEIKPVTTAQYPALPARRPLHPVTDKSSIKRVFGIEMPAWEAQLRAFLTDFAPRHP